MSNLILLAHPGAHPHPHDANWLAVIADNPFMAVAVAAGAAMVVSLVWRALARRG